MFSDKKLFMNFSSAPMRVTCLTNRVFIDLNFFKDEAQTALFKDPVRTAQ
jgi:hypothetical protein